MDCKYCSEPCNKCGKQRNGKQRYCCKVCLKYQQDDYQKHAYNIGINDQITSMIKEGVGIRSIGRLLKISKNTVLSRTKFIAASITKPTLIPGGIYEVDEIWTFCQSKKTQQWISYIYSRSDKTVVDFVVGHRSRDFLKPMISGILKSRP